MENCLDVPTFIHDNDKLLLRRFRRHLVRLVRFFGASDAANVYPLTRIFCSGRSEPRCVRERQISSCFEELRAGDGDTIAVFFGADAGSGIFSFDYQIIISKVILSLPTCVDTTSSRKYSSYLILRLLPCR